MQLVGLILNSVGLFGGVLWWLFGLRPFLRRHHDGYNTGANLMVAAWVDWQRCGEIAKEQDDPVGRRLYWGFAILQLSLVFGIALYFIEPS